MSDSSGKKSGSTKVALKQSERRIVVLFRWRSKTLVQNMRRAGGSSGSAKLLRSLGHISSLVSMETARLQLAEKMTSPSRMMTDLPPVLMPVHFFSHLKGGRIRAQ